MPLVDLHRGPTRPTRLPDARRSPAPLSNRPPLLRLRIDSFLKLSDSTLDIVLLPDSGITESIYLPRRRGLVHRPRDDEDHDGPLLRDAPPPWPAPYSD